MASADLTKGATLDETTVAAVKRRLPMPPLSSPRQDGQPGDESVRPSGAWTSYGLDVLPPLNAVLELAAVSFALLAVDWAWPSLDINNLQPSPYSLGVLLLSLQYGTASGSLAVMVAIAAYFSFSTLPDEGVGENEFTYRLRILAQPILWICAAVILGQFRMVQIAAKRELTRRVGELEDQGRTLAEYASRLRGRCDALERDIVGRRDAEHQGLLDAMGRLREGAFPAEPDIAACLAAVSSGGAASFYVRTPAGFIRTVSIGWPDDASWLDQVPNDHPLAQAMVQGHHTVTVLHASDEHVLAAQGLAATPVLDVSRTRVLGMLKIERADASVITPALEGRLSVVVDALAPRMPEFLGALAGSQVQTRVQGPQDSNHPPRTQLNRLELVPVGDRARPKVGL